MKSSTGWSSMFLVAATAIPLTIIWVILAVTGALPWGTLLGIAIAIVVLIAFTMLRYRREMNR